VGFHICETSGCGVLAILRRHPFRLVKSWVWLPSPGCRAEPLSIRLAGRAYQKI
jgi:hypothetical protein